MFPTIRSRNAKTIRDGQTRTAYIAPSPGIHDAFAFQYRPPVSTDIGVYEAEINASNAKDSGARVRIDCILEYMTEWSEIIDDETPLPINLENVRSLPYFLMLKIYNVITGWTSTDPLPASDETETDHRDFVASTGERPIVTRENEVKN